MKENKNILLIAASVLIVVIIFYSNRSEKIEFNPENISFNLKNLDSSSAQKVKQALPNSNFIENKPDSTKIEAGELVKLDKQFNLLKEAMINKDVNSIVSIIEFPLDARSAYAFGYDFESIDSTINRDQLLANYSHFFKDVMIDSLKSETNYFDIYSSGNEIRWSLRIQTYTPGTKQREWGEECTHSVWGKLDDNDLIIDGFDLLCGGIL